MDKLRANVLLIVMVGAIVLLPAAGANHLPNSRDCTGARETLLAGGLIEFALGLGPGILACHHDTGCQPAGPCVLEIELTVRGTGVVEGIIEPLQGDPPQTCGPVLAECTLTISAAADEAHELHVNCGFGGSTFAINVDFECHVRPT